MSWHRKTLFITLFFLGTSLRPSFLHCEILLEEGQEEITQGPLFVSLGSHCSPALILRKAGIRKAAYPFDWAVSVDGHMLIQGIREGFIHFCHPQYLVASATKPGFLLQTYYHMEFKHDGYWLGPDYEENLPSFCKKYERRLARFNNIKFHDGTVYFIRQALPRSDSDAFIFKNSDNNEISPTYATHLYAALKETFPKPEVRLIIINPPSKGTRKMHRISPNIVIVSADVTNIDIFKVVKFFK